MVERKKLPPTHPGELLRKEILPAAGLTQHGLAELIGVSRFTVNQILRERRSVTADMAHRLARLFDTTPEFWLDLQQDGRPLAGGKGRIRAASEDQTFAKNGIVNFGVEMGGTEDEFRRLLKTSILD